MTFELFHFFDLRFSKFAIFQRVLFLISICCEIPLSLSLFEIFLSVDIELLFKKNFQFIQSNFFSAEIYYLGVTSQSITSHMKSEVSTC